MATIIGKVYYTEAVVTLVPNPTALPLTAISTEEIAAVPGSRYSLEVQERARSREAALTAARVIERLIGEPVSVKFARHAGCSVCPCSPGFVVRAEAATPLTQLLTLDITYAPRSNERRSDWLKYDKDECRFNIWMTGNEISTFRYPRQFFKHVIDLRVQNQPDPADPAFIGAMV